MIPPASLMRLVPAAIFMGLGVVLVLAAFQAFMAGLIVLPTDHLRDRLFGQNNLAAAEVQALTDNRLAALRWWPSAKWQDDLAMLALRKAELQQDLPHQRAAMAEMLKIQEKNLAQQPVNPFGWARLAYGRAFMYGPSALVTQPLEKSIQTGQYEPDLMVSRTTLLMATKKFWTPYLKAVADRQLIMAWRWQVTRFALVQAALDNGWLEELYGLYRAQAPHLVPELVRVEQAVYWSRQLQPPSRALSQHPSPQLAR